MKLGPIKVVYISLPRTDLKAVVVIDNTAGATKTIAYGFAIACFQGSATLKDGAEPAIPGPRYRPKLPQVILTSNTKKGDLRPFLVKNRAREFYAARAANQAKWCGLAIAIPRGELETAWKDA